MNGARKAALLALACMICAAIITLIVLVIRHFAGR